MMMKGVTRRRAVKLAATGTVATLATGAVQAQTQTEAAKECKTYSGSSNKGDIQEALASAIAEAHKAAPGADRQVRWCIKKVSGVNGGISPLNIATVEIEVTLS
jgi:hypothetical protein